MADYRTETQKISDALREAIISGKYKPGERLPQRQIASSFGTTTIVAREALRLLETERLVAIEPRFGAMVQEITPKILKERYIVREALEGMAARLATENMTSFLKKELYEVASRCDKELISNDLNYKEKASLHQSFHDIILEITGCDELNKLLKTIYMNSLILSNAYRIEWSEDTPMAHSQLVDALVSEDPDVAEKAMREHVRNGMHMELKGLQ